MDTGTQLIHPFFFNQRNIQKFKHAFIFFCYYDVENNKKKHLSSRRQRGKEAKRQKGKTEKVREMGVSSNDYDLIYLEEKNEEEACQTMDSQENENGLLTMMNVIFYLLHSGFAKAIDKFYQKVGRDKMTSLTCNRKEEVVIFEKNLDVIKQTMESLGYGKSMDVRIPESEFIKRVMYHCLALDMHDVRDYLLQFPQYRPFWFDGKVNRMGFTMSPIANAAALSKNESIMVLLADPYLKWHVSKDTFRQLAIASCMSDNILIFKNMMILLGSPLDQISHFHTNDILMNYQTKSKRFLLAESLICLAMQNNSINIENHIYDHPKFDYRDFFYSREIFRVDNDEAIRRFLLRFKPIEELKNIEFGLKKETTAANGIVFIFYIKLKDPRIPGSASEHLNSFAFFEMLYFMKCTQPDFKIDQGMIKGIQEYIKEGDTIADFLRTEYKNLKENTFYKTKNLQQYEP